MQHQTYPHMNKVIKIKFLKKKKKKDLKDTDRFNSSMRKPEVQMRRKYFFISGEQPSSYESAVKEEIWRQAMREEMEAIENKSTWDLVKPHEKSRPIGVKWIYKIKRNSTVEITRHKARLVAKGYSKKRGKDFDEVFSPDARIESIQLVIALEAQLKWNSHHLDVKSAFLSGEIEEEIYVNQSEGFIKKGKKIMF